MDLLDESKENVQPLKRGRNISTLNTALQAQTDVDVYRQLKKEREDFEVLLRSYSGDDPLKPWYDYVQWVEQNFPKHGKDGNLKLLLENCLGQFKDSEEYSQDIRYIDLWTRYMSFTDNPLEIYKQIHARGIGTYCAIFYQCWAEEYELADDVKRADQIFIEGIKRNAQPIEELKAAHNDFQVRVARGILGQNPIAYQDMQFESRSALSALRAHGRKRNMVDSNRIGNSIKFATPGVLRPHSNTLDKRNGNSHQPKIAVFNDENAEFCDAVASTQIKPTISMKRELVNKENTLQPGRWNEGKNKKKSSTACGAISIPVAPKTPSFHVHVDENLNTPSTPSTDIAVSNVLKVRKHIYEDEKNIPIAVNEPPDPSKKAMYPKNKVYSGGTEFSLEELRAIIYMKRLGGRGASREKSGSSGSANVQKKLSYEETEVECRENGHFNKIISTEPKCGSNSDTCGNIGINRNETIEALVAKGNFDSDNNGNAGLKPDEIDSVKVVKGSFEVFVDDEVNATSKMTVPLQETTLKVKKPIPPVLQCPKELPFSGVDLKVVKRHKERKISDDSDSCSSTSVNKDFDQSLTVNTKAVLKDVKDMWVSPLPAGNSKFLESLHPGKSVIDHGNCDKADAQPVSSQNGLVPFRIFSETNDVEESNRINVYDSQENLRKNDNKRSIGSIREVSDNRKILSTRATEAEVPPVGQCAPPPVNEFFIYADSFVERQPERGIPFVGSPGMTPMQIAAMVGTEDKENLQSSRKQLFSSDNSKKGVLEPSKDIYCLPLAGTNTVENMEEDNRLSDETCCTEAFDRPLVSSTPLVHPLIKYCITDQEKMDFPQDNTINLMNINRGEIVSKQKDILEDKMLAKNLENGMEKLTTESAVPQCTSVDQVSHLSIIYEVSEYKRSLSSGETTTLKACGFESQQKLHSSNKTSFDLIKIPEFEEDIRNYTLHFNSFIEERNPNYISEPAKAVKFFSDTFRDLCLKKANFPNKKHVQHCQRVAEQWNVHDVDVGTRKFLKNELFILSNLSTSRDTYLWRALDRSTNEVVFIKTESLSRLWQYYVKEEIRLRIKDSTLVNQFGIEDQIYIYNNSVVTISSTGNFKNLQDFLVDCHSRANYVISESNALYIASNMIKIIHNLHECKIIHGNISVHSFLINPVPESGDGSMILNDFGYAVDITLLAPDTLFDATERTIFNKCHACNVSPYKVDYIGLADTLHHLIFNKPLDVFEHHGSLHIYTTLPSNFSDFWIILFEELLNLPEVNLRQHYTKTCHYLKSPDVMEDNVKFLNLLSSNSV